MITKIIKRDGRIAEFNSEKIMLALAKAVENSKEDVNVYKITKMVLKKIDKTYDDEKNLATVESIQDLIEETLVEENYPATAKGFIIYRSTRTQAREAKSRLTMKIRDITFSDAKNSDVKRENANIDGNTAMGTMLKYGSETSKDFYLHNLIKKEYADAHLSGDIHIHDLDFYTLTLTCCQIDLLKLFKSGFSTGHGFLREPNDIRSYAALTCIAIQANQNDMHGGQSVPNFDYVMAEGVAKTYRKIFRNNLIKIIEVELDRDVRDEITNLFLELKAANIAPLYLNEKSTDVVLAKIKTLFPNLDLSKTKKYVVRESNLEIKKQTYEAMEALIHNFNTMHSRAGAQVPFSSLNYGTCTSAEARLAMECLLDSTMAGLGNGETAIFPIQIFKVKDGVSYKEGDPNYDLFLKSIECSSKRLFPNFSFLDAPFNLKYYKENDYNSEVAYMGCRTRVMANEFDKTKEVTCGRGNLSFTSINLPRIALKTKNVNLFFEELDKKLSLVINQLLERFEIQCQKRPYNFPFLMEQGVWLDSEKLARDEEIREAIKHGTLSIGFIGLSETLVALIGRHHGESKEAQELGLKIIGRIRQRCDEACEKYHINFSCIATPAEGLSGRFIKADKIVFGEIPGITDREFYTNSFHVPVYYPISVFKKIEIEAPYHNLTNAGHISYIEIDGDTSKNIKAFETIIRHMKETGIGYGAVNHPLDRDPICGYNGVIDNVCPKCGRDETKDHISFERIRRITGYLVGTLDRFNDAKRAEVEARVKHGFGKK